MPAVFVRPLLSLAFVGLVTAACAPEQGGDATPEDAMPEAADEATSAAVAGAEEVMGYFETHYNMGHGSMVANRFAEQAILWGGDGSMLHGREAIAATFEAQIANAGTQVAIHPGEVMGFGDTGLARGHFVMTGEQDGEEVRSSGHYFAVVGPAEGGVWEIHAMITNRDGQDQLVLPAQMTDAPEGQGAELTQAHADYFVTHLNMGHAGMVAETFTEDAVLMGSGSSLMEGRESVQGWLQSAVDGGVALGDMTTWGARTLSDEYVAGIGTFSATSPAEATSGHFAALYRRAEDGTLLLHWLLTAERPASM